MENHTNVDALNKNQSIASNSLKTHNALIVLVVLVCFLGFVGGYHLGTRSSIVKQSATKTLSPTNVAKEIETNKSSLPFPVARVKKQFNYSSWNQYKDKSGYIFYYPTDWFASSQQVQNWDPNSAGRPRTPSGEETKWDLSFNEQSFSSFEEALNGGWDSIEVSSTSKGWPVYFAYIEKTEPEGAPYLVAVVVTPDNKVLSWHGFLGDAKSTNIEKLKQIVESLEK